MITDGVLARVKELTVADAENLPEKAMEDATDGDVLPAPKEGSSKDLNPEETASSGGSFDGSAQEGPASEVLIISIYMVFLHQ